MYIDTYANDTFTHSYNITLDNTQIWTAQTHVVNLNYLPLIANVVANTPIDIGYLSSNLSVVNTNLPNAYNNYNLTISANSLQTQLFNSNGVNIAERILIIQTSFTSNTGQVQHSPDLYLKVKNSTV